MSDRVRIYVKVAGRPGAEEDREVPGSYVLAVDADLSVADRASAALDAFHEKVGIKQLDDFEITTWDEMGQEIVQGEAESYTMGAHAEYQGMLDEEDLSVPKGPGG